MSNRIEHTQIVTLAADGALERVDSNKRVSFVTRQDGEVLKQTFVYDTYQQPTTSDRNFAPFKRLKVCTKEPPSRLTVQSGVSECPVPIQPPASISTTGELRSVALQHSSPLPSLQRPEMDFSDNPFRPEGELNHSVDPIVDKFLKKPYGDVSDSYPSTPVKPPKSPPKKAEKPSSKKDKKRGSKDKGSSATPDKQRESLNAEPVVRPSDVQLQDASHAGANNGTTATTTIVDTRRTQLPSPKAGKVELVHVEDKKRKCCRCCGCCVQ